MEYNDYIDVQKYNMLETVFFNTNFKEENICE